MKKICAILFVLCTLAACADQSGSVDISRYQGDPNERTVNVDDHHIHVVPTGYHQYVAWGGADDRDGRIQYRQRRAIELISKCRIAKNLSPKTDTTTRATVKC